MQQTQGWHALGTDAKNASANIMIGDRSIISYLMCNERNSMEPSSFITNWQVRIRVHKIVVKEPHVCQGEDGWCALQAD
jgi:hypothetical protein